MGMRVEVKVKPTLDPDVHRFETNRWLTGMGGKLYLAEKFRPKGAPKPRQGTLESKLLEIGGVVSVYVYGSTVTVSKEPERSWDDLEPQIKEVLENAFSYYSRAS
ncbi:MAG: hypothetical protein C4318_08740 [Acidimicrobiia bacterium]